MKKPFILVVLLLFAVVQLPAQRRTIDNPVYDFCNSGIENVAKVELSPKETRLHVHATFVPGWWVQYSKNNFIRDCATGKQYFAVSMEGGEFDTQISMPASGEQSFVLVFPALPKDVQKIDFGDSVTTYVYGISLDKKAVRKTDAATVPEEVSKWIDGVVSQDGNYTGPGFFGRDTVRLVGYIKGYDPRAGFTTGKIMLRNELTNETAFPIVTVHPGGRFEAEIPMGYPVITNLNFLRYYIPIYIEQGKNTGLILDWQDFIAADRYRDRRYLFQNVEYLGPLAEVNRQLQMFTPFVRDYNQFTSEVKTIEPMEFKRRGLEKFKEESGRLEKCIEDNNISGKAAALLRASVNVSMAYYLLDFSMYRAMEARTDTVNPVFKIPLKLEYFDFLKQIPLNDTLLVSAPEFMAFINRLEYSPGYCTAVNDMSMVRHSLPPASVFAALHKKGVELTAGELELERWCDSVRGMMYADKSLVAESNARILSGQYDDFYEKYGRNSVDITEHYLMNEEYEKRIFEAMGVAPGLMYDIIKLRSLCNYFKNNIWTKPQATGVTGTVTADISEQFLREEAWRVLLSVYPEKDEVFVLPEGEAADIFRGIIAPFKGKLLFVDFWATTCGPCVAGIRNMQETREKYKDDERFAFIFITDESQSPKATYDKMVEEQGMVNSFRLNRDQFNRMYGLFGFSGIPYYIVVDKDGNIMDKHFYLYPANLEQKLREVFPQ